MNPVLGFIYLLFYFVYTCLEALVRIFVPVQKKSFAGKLVLVTGAGHGIGRELAVQFSRLGARLVLWDINKDNNERVAKEIRRNGHSANTYVCDVSKLDTIKAMAAKLKTELGDVDVLVNNAGVVNGGALLQMAESDIKRTMDINIMAYIWTCREFLPAMINKKKGHIINMASMAGKGGFAYLTDYTASKFAITGFTEALADEMRREGHLGIKFTTVFPMFVDTGFARSQRTILSSLSATEVATAVITAAQRDEKTVYLPSAIEWLTRLEGLSPQKFADKVKEIFIVGIDPQYGEKLDKTKT